MSLAHAKRFLERWIADPSFQKVVRKNPIDACERYGIRIDPYAVKPIWKKSRGRPFGKHSGEHFGVSLAESEAGDYPLLAELEKLFRSMANDDLVVRAEAAKDIGYKAWRKRQIARCKSQFKKEFRDSTLHISAFFELSKGCSGQCWFCALDPAPLKAVFEYNSKNRNLWRDVLRTMSDILGQAAGASVCYGATEPLDNPDYEKFCLDYWEILGIFPPTVTAKPTESFARTRRLINMNRQINGRSPAFSVGSLKELDSIYAEFSAEELLRTYLALHNRESTAKIIHSGRALRHGQRKAFSGVGYHTGRTLACASGFLFNMVDKSVRLISPCIPDEKWPLGYQIYDRNVFEDARDLKRILLDMIGTHMPTHLRETDKVKFRSDLTYGELENGFELSTPFIARRFCNIPYLKALGEIVHSGERTVGEIVSVCEFFTIPKTDVLNTLTFMFAEGLLHEELQSS